MWATHTLFKWPGFNCVSLVASPPLLKYLPTPLVGNPIIKILDTPLPQISINKQCSKSMQQSIKTPYKLKLMKFQETIKFATGSGKAN